MLRLLILFVIVPIYTVLMCLIAPLLPHNRTIDLRYRKVVKHWANTILWAAKIEVRIAQSDVNKLVTPYSQIVVSNHQSNIDSIVFLAIMPPEANACFAAKSVLFRIPFYGKALKRIGSVEIDRGKGSLSMKRLRNEFIDTGIRRSLILFPEGTRSPKGKIASFKKGAFVLSRDSGARLLPIFMSGTSDVLPKGAAVPRSGKVDVKVMAPVEANSISEMGVESSSNFISAMMLREYDSVA